MAALAPVLLASVPSAESDLARRFLPGAAFSELPPGAALARLHPDVQVLVVAAQDHVDVEALTIWPRLEAVVTRSSGTDHIDVAALHARGVRVCHLGGYATTSVVEHTLGLVFALVRRLPETMALTQGVEPSWDRTRVPPRGLDEVAVGVLGTGRIGGGVVRRLAGLGVPVVGYDLAPDPALAEVPGFAYVDDLDELLAGCDVLSLHVPLTQATRRLLDAERLARLPRGAVLINTARGAIVDQDAVLAALATGRLAGYAADVLPGEPHPPELARFQAHPRVIITPHTAAYDRRALTSRYETTARLVTALLARDRATITRYLADPQGL